MKAGKERLPSKEYTTVNRFYTAGFKDGTSFDTLVNSKIAERYNVDKIENKNSKCRWRNMGKTRRRI